MKSRASSLIFALSAVAAATVRADPRLSTPVDVFVGGVGYPNYRSPTITAMPDGTLVAVAEGRSFDDPGYGGDLDIVSRRSTDGGVTWSTMQVVDAWAGGTSSNPTTVLDSTTGRLFLLYNRWEGNHGTADSMPGTTNNTGWFRYSDNGGQTWSAATDITTSVKDYNNWNTIAFGPGSGIQASNGRLLIPSARWLNGWNGYAVYSSDHGATWTRGSIVPGGNLSGENTLVQLASGQILMDARPNISGPASRLDSTSSNGGLTWSAMTSGQYSPESQAALERLSFASTGDINRILFTGPKGPDRTDLIIRASYDEAQSYVNERLLYDGYSGYSDITILPDQSIGVFFETNEARSLTFLKLNRETIEPPQGLKAYEGFRYNTSTLGTKNGGLLWNAGWTASPTTLSGTPNVKIENSDLYYTNFPFANEGGRRAYLQQGGTMARALPTTVNLGANQTYYLSLLVREDTLNTVETDTDSTEAFDVLLYSGAARQLAFGVHGNESFYIDLPGFGASTAAKALDKDVPYYIVAKIVAHDVASGLNDQLYLKAFRSGDAVPAMDDGLGWTLASTTGANMSSIIDRLAIKGGSLSDWLVDELRVGTTFGSVVSNAYKWAADANGTWRTGSNWLDGAPSAPNLTAIFGSAITAPRTVALDTSHTVGRVIFDNSNTYTLSGAGTLQFTAASSASIDVLQGSHAISTNVSFTSPLIVTTSPGTTLSLAGSNIGAWNSLTKQGAGRLIVKELHATSVNVNAGKLIVQANGGNTGISYIDTLTVGAFASLDLNDNDLVVNNGSFSTLQALVLAGYRGGPDTSATGIVSTTSQTIHGGTTILALFDNALAGFTDYPFGSGHAIGASAVVGKYTYIGDTNYDGQVTPQDYTATDANLNTSVDPAISWFYGDTNFDGNIDASDYTGIDAALGLGQGNPLSVQAISVPEPTSTALGLILANSILRKRSRRPRPV